MIASDLPNLARYLASGPDLQVALTMAINEALADASGTKMQRLKTCLTAAIVYVDTGEDTAVPTVSTRTQTFTDKVIVITYTEGLDPYNVPLTTDFAITSPARTINRVEIDGPRVKLHYDGTLLVTADSPEVAYTQPGATQARLQDMAGNLVATHAAAAVTVAGS